MGENDRFNSANPENGTSGLVMIDTTDKRGKASHFAIEEEEEQKEVDPNHDDTSIRTEVEDYEPRTELPVLRDPNDRPSIWKILSSVIGKDATKFSMPVFMNEPISMVQKVVEIMEYED